MVERRGSVLGLNYFSLYLWIYVFGKLNSSSVWSMISHISSLNYSTILLDPASTFSEWIILSKCLLQIVLVFLLKWNIFYYKSVHANEILCFDQRKIFKKFPHISNWMTLDRHLMFLFNVFFWGEGSRIMAQGSCIHAWWFSVQLTHCAQSKQCWGPDLMAGEETGLRCWGFSSGPAHVGLYSSPLC